MIVPMAGIPSDLKATLSLPRFAHLSLFNSHHNAQATAEMGIALLLATTRRVAWLDSILRDGIWVRNPANAFVLSGLTAVVVGYGNIGRRVAKVLKALGMEVLGVKRSAKSPTTTPLPPTGGGGGGNSGGGGGGETPPAPSSPAPSSAAPKQRVVVSGDVDPEDSTELFPPSALNTLLPSASVVILALPDTAETEGVMGAAEFAVLPLPSCVVNLGRASACDEVALWEWLQPNHGSSYGGDVWWNERVNQCIVFHREICSRTLMGYSDPAILLPGRQPAAFYVC